MGNEELNIRIQRLNKDKTCKICKSSNLTFFAHTASCSDCGVLLNFPYAQVRETDFLERNVSPEDIVKARSFWLAWHISSGARNHHNFTNMALFCEKYISRDKNLEVLDYGGGGGQFSLVLKSLYPRSKSMIVDMDDLALLEEYVPMNRQIKFAGFEKDETKFDFIFMNDVFEHLTFPHETLALLHEKLTSGGKIFIDTPSTFWLYNMTKLFSKKVHTKLLNGTVDFDHQQIWTKKSFYTTCQNAGFSVIKFERLSEFTQPPSYYLNNMRIENLLLRFLGLIFVKLSPLIARNKIMAILEKKGNSD